MIEFKNVKKSFRDTQVLHDISMQIQEGELVVLIGPSGCGKTTTLKMINRLIDQTEGKIYIDGKDIAKENPIKLRRNIGYVIQQTGLFPHLTIQENIEIIPKIENFDSEKIVERTEELMELVGLDKNLLDRYPNELSGGQQQRVGVARAFALDPEIILMDEPFSAVDPITRASLQDELVDLQKELRRTIVFVTHDMSEAVKIADRICIMNKGEIVQYDTPENILKNPINDFVADFVGRNRIWNSPEYIKAKDILLDDVVTCSSSIMLSRATNIMRNEKVNSLMVVEKRNHKLLGIINPRIIQQIEDRQIPVSDAMIKDFRWASPDESIVDLLKIIEEDDISEIPILDDGKLIGLVTENSLVTTLSEQFIEKGDQ